ncbi:hypothetical protein PO124_12070 [Bacillus licheniformis]|nr:hypothetical protein [Bacillus licheniformis]
MLNIEVMTIPTIPGTCAASTPLSVIYDDEGNFRASNIRSAPAI